MNRRTLLAGGGTLTLAQTPPFRNLMGHPTMSLMWDMASIPLQFTSLGADYVEHMAQVAIGIFSPPQEDFHKLKQLIKDGGVGRVAYEAYDRACLNGRLVELAEFIGADHRDRILLLQDKLFCEILAEKFFPEWRMQPVNAKELSRYLPVFDLLDDEKLGTVNKGVF